jgi:hypothetical protein
MTGRVARLPPCPCAKHMPLSRRGGTVRVDRPEGGTLRQEPGGQEAQDPLWGARQKRARDDDMTLYRHRHHMWSANDPRAMVLERTVLREFQERERDILASCSRSEEASGGGMAHE